MFVPKKLGLTLIIGSLLVACTSTPKKPTTDTTDTAATTSTTPSPVDANEPDLEKLAKERAAQGIIAKAKDEEKPTISTGDTSIEPVLPEASAELKKLAAPVLASYQQAIVLMKARQLNEAYALFDEVQAKAPMFSGPVINQAAIRIQQQNMKDAEILLKKAIAINEKNPFAYNLQGVFYRQQGKFADARTAYEKALTLSPNYAKAHYNFAILADLYLQDLPLALQHYEAYQALQRKPDANTAKWIVDLQKRTGVYKAPVKPVQAEEITVEETPAPAATDTAPADSPVPTATVAPNTTTAESVPTASTDNTPPPTVAPPTENAPVAKEVKKSGKKPLKGKNQANNVTSDTATPVVEAVKSADSENKSNSESAPVTATGVQP